MRRDGNAFKERFQRWKAGEQIYDKGRIIPHYEDGTEGEVETLPYDKSIDFLYKIENPRFKNVNREKGLVKFFDDGWAPTIGAGVANTSGAPSEWFDGQWHKKKDVDDFAYDYFSHGDEVIRAAYDKKYGTPEYPNPSDTLSLWPRMYMAQNRYQRGSLGGGATGRNAILSAVASGNTQNIVNAITKFTSPGDNNRMKRVLSAYPPVYEEKNGTDNFFDKIKKKIQTMALLNAPKSITE